MARSVLADAPFVQTTLTFTTEGGWGTDENGNPVRIPGEPIELLASVTPDRGKQVVREPGADAHLTPVRCELLEPLTLPDGCTKGSTLTLTWAGLPSTLLITSVTENDLVGVDFGTYFEGEVTPDG